MHHQNVIGHALVVDKHRVKVIFFFFELLNVVYRGIFSIFLWGGGNINTYELKNNNNNYFNSFINIIENLCVK